MSGEDIAGPVESGGRADPAREDSLDALHRRAGAWFGDFHGAQVPRRYGDPVAELAAARTGVGIIDRSYRGRLELTGRAPGQMLSGVVTGRIPGPARSASDADPALWTGRAEYSAILTAKGRMIADLRLMRWPGEDERFLLDLPVAGITPTGAELARVLPPRFAAVADMAPETAHLTVLGPEASAAVIGAMGTLGWANPTAAAAAVEGLTEGDAVFLDPSRAIVATGDASPGALDLLVSTADAVAAWKALVAAGARPVGRGVWDTLRVEAGRPLFGQDMDDRTIPIEAGIEARAVDGSKGCYTGQEVIVRIRDRGHVNRHLRGLLLGDTPTRPGAELFGPDGGRSVGTITSVATSELAGQTLGLGMVRRELEPPAMVRVGASDGPEAGVRALGADAAGRAWYEDPSEP